MRIFLVAVMAGLAVACSPPPAATTETPDAPAVSAPGVDDAQTQLLLNVLQPVVADEVGQPVSLQPTTVNVRDEWAYVDAQVRNGDGTEINWTTTNLASRYENGAMDTGGGVHALLKNENGTWVVLEHVIAPTDVAWIDWASRHGVAPDILGLPSN
ncbi:hypothetical protein [Candidatus Viadribacter manganicus]|nr:hypothetical protein [Candidatus Viadribacter manganicus]